eukprot:1158253-Pelagomonas_calceolata.AAC.8
MASDVSDKGQLWLIGSAMSICRQSSSINFYTKARVGQLAPVFRTGQRSLHLLVHVAAPPWLPVMTCSRHLCTRIR